MEVAGVHVRPGDPVHPSVTGRAEAGDGRIWLSREAVLRPFASAGVSLGANRDWMADRDALARGAGGHRLFEAAW